MNQNQRYNKLVNRINNRLDMSNDYFINCSNLKMDEVNAWTYWQGRGNRHPRILLLGQDWGAINTNRSRMFIDNIRSIINSSDSPNGSVHYFDNMSGTTLFQTDEHIRRLFSVLEYKEIQKTHYSDLFFTNLIPGFRNDKKSMGGFKNSWISTDVIEEFTELVDILKPQIIICLGRGIYRAVLKMYGQKVSIKKWTNYLNRFYNTDTPDPIAITKNTFVFPVVHPGVYGTRSRSITDQENDWDKIHKWMIQNNFKKNP